MRRNRGESSGNLVGTYIHKSKWLGKISERKKMKESILKEYNKHNMNKER